MKKFLKENNLSGKDVIVAASNAASPRKSLCLNVGCKE